MFPNLFIRTGPKFRSGPGNHSPIPCPLSRKFHQKCGNTWKLQYICLIYLFDFWRQGYSLLRWGPINIFVNFKLFHLDWFFGLSQNIPRPVFASHSAFKLRLEQLLNHQPDFESFAQWFRDLSLSESIAENAAPSKSFWPKIVTHIKLKKKRKIVVTIL